MNKKSFLFSVFFILTLTSSHHSQSIRIKLDSLTTLDSDEFGIIFLEQKLNEKVILPDFGVSEPKFFEMFYSWDTKDDHLISCAVIQQKDRELLFIDTNNNEDFTDEQSMIFPNAQNDFYVDIISQLDAKQKLKLKLFRTVSVPDSVQNKLFDDSGNMNPAFAKMMSNLDDKPHFAGEKGSFYLGGRVTLRRGTLQIDSVVYQVGVFDFSNNGLWNDESDLLLIDYNQNNKLNLFDEEGEIHKLNDVFSLGASRYRVKYVDKYGEWIEIEKTEEQATFYYLTESKRSFTSSHGEGAVDKFLWELTKEDLNGNSISFKDYKGKYLLLNFWGEWCKPCREEIPDLIEIYDNISRSKLEIISFLKPSDLETAKKFIKNSKMKWTQIILTDEIEDKFKVRGYPTNILIHPDGTTYTKYGQVSKDNIAKLIGDAK
ncbi:MAG: TlpA family protein disulfide reductase [Ignavibacteriales bacterium]|nr:TlpA family protein disulfide reductase [Ignavibacteriales bacterium]